MDENFSISAQRFLKYLRTNWKIRWCVVNVKNSILRTSNILKVNFVELSDNLQYETDVLSYMGKYNFCNQICKISLLFLIKNWKTSRGARGPNRTRGYGAGGRGSRGRGRSRGRGGVRARGGSTASSGSYAEENSLISHANDVESLASSNFNEIIEESLDSLDKNAESKYLLLIK